MTEYNAAATRLASGNVFVPSRGVVHFFGSYVHGDDNRHESKLAHKLISFLGRHFKISLKYEVDVWTDRKIPLGTGWARRIQQAIQDCDFGILLVSPAFLARQFTEDYELVHFVADGSESSRKPVIPVGQ